MRLLHTLTAAVLSVSLLTSLPLAAAVSPPPATTTVKAQDSYHGKRVEDPYRWLEKASSPEVQRWIDAQNAYAEKILGTYPGREALSARVRALSITSERRLAPQLVGNTLFYLSDRPPQEQPVLVAQPWPTGPARVLVDPNKEAATTAITQFWPSPDGRYLAYSTADKGTEDSVIRILDLRTGKLLSEVLKRAGGGTTPTDLAWDPGSRSFVYTRFPVGSTAPFNVGLFGHKVGTAQDQDKPQLVREASPYDEYDLSAPAGNKYILALVQAGDGEAKSVYARDNGEWVRLLRPREGVIAGTMTGDRIYVVATGGSPRGRVVLIEKGTFRTLVPEDPEWSMREIDAVAGGLLVREVKGPDWRIRQFDSAGKFVRTLALPETGIAFDAVAASDDSPDVLIAYSGWTTPTRWARYDSRTGTLKELFAVKPAVDYSGIVATRITATSKDGTAVPVTVLARKDLPKDGKVPTLLTAYGGYGIANKPTFLGANLAWLEKGGALAVANIRGGGEFGEAWHENGRLVRKQNVFDDFIAASEALIGQGWTSAGKLGIYGGSNGGLLMGAALTQRPDLYRAVVSSVGIYDMLRVELHPNGAFNTPEFGSVSDPEQFAALYAYSPLHRVKDATAYPAVLMLTGENDPRVDAYQSRKMAARLQAASTSGHPVLVLTRRDAGHGIGASFSQKLGDAAARLIFFAGELGL